jgi:hypothetical protein
MDEHTLRESDGDNPGLDKYHSHIGCFAAQVFERGSSARLLRAMLAVLLLSIVPAPAEAAWVLWNMSTEKPRTTYVEAAQLTAQQQCAAERDFIQLSADLAVKQGVPNRGPESYLCLPDTIDPRGAEARRAVTDSSATAAFALGPRA